MNEELLERLRSKVREQLGASRVVTEPQSSSDEDSRIRLVAFAEKTAEQEAIRWLWKSETDVDREKVLTLFEVHLRRLWTRRGYSQRWIDKQFAFKLGS